MRQALSVVLVLVVLEEGAGKQLPAGRAPPGAFCSLATAPPGDVAGGIVAAAVRRSPAIRSTAPANSAPESASRRMASKTSAWLPSANRTICRAAVGDNRPTLVLIKGSFLWATPQRWSKLQTIQAEMLYPSRNQSSSSRLRSVRLVSFIS